MAKLTKRSLGLTDGYSSSYKRDDLIQKLGQLEYAGSQIAQEMCDFGCRYPMEADAYELDSICDACPIRRLVDMLK